MPGVGFSCISHQLICSYSSSLRGLLSPRFLLVLWFWEERGMASSSLSFQEEKMSEHETSDVVSPEKLKRNRVQAADVHPTLKNYHEELIGCKVMVWCPVDEMFYGGKITSVNRLLCRHQVEYDDGGKELVDLSKDIWELVGDEELSGGIQEQETTPGSSPSDAVFGNSGPSTKKHMIAVGKATTASDEKKTVAKRKSRSDEGQAIHQNNAGGASNMTTSRISTYQKRSRRLHRPSSAYAQSGNAPTQMENVSGHQVKASVAPTLRFIFAKHGDILSNTSFKYFPEFTTTLLDIVSDVVKKLLRDDFDYVLSELNSMITLVDVVAMAELDVSWLQKHLAEFDEVKKLAIKAATKDLDAKKKIMMVAKKQFKEIQRRLF
ncbi:hypothetical protein Pfo_011904 [Paulownia fortunei]|nr:hypothetical protein Pfo_011904 [Paulownia fortunei]